MSVVDFKKFNTSVVAPHEALMALEPEVFPWEGKVVTDYNILLQREDLKQPENDSQADILNHEFISDESALAKIDV